MSLISLPAGIESPALAELLSQVLAGLNGRLSLAASSTDDWLALLSPLRTELGDVPGGMRQQAEQLRQAFVSGELVLELTSDVHLQGAPTSFHAGAGGGAGIRLNASWAANASGTDLERVLLKQLGSAIAAPPQVSEEACNAAADGVFRLNGDGGPALQETLQYAQSLITSWLQWKEPLTALHGLFSGGSSSASAAWLSQAQGFLDALLAGELGVTVELRSFSELLGAHGAFTARSLLPVAPSPTPFPAAVHCSCASRR